MIGLGMARKASTCMAGYSKYILGNGPLTSSINTVVDPAHEHCLPCVAPRFELRSPMTMHVVHGSKRTIRVGSAPG